MSYIKRFVAWCKEKGVFKAYTRFKLWLRQSRTGIVIDRAFRFFVITAISTFLTNYVAGQEVLPVLQSSLAVAGIALYDKIKNEWFASIREENEITRL